MIELVARLLPPVLRIIAGTVRLQVDGQEHLEAVAGHGRPFLFAVWHGRILLPIHRHRDQGVVAMVSLSRDGDLATGVLKGLGYKAVRGSSSRGGKEAFHGMIARIAEGRSGAVIPDGPRGPARTLKPGLLYIAQQAQVPILPLSAATAPRRHLSSWDRLLVPCPFARGILAYGPPLSVPADASPAELERLRVALEAELTRLEQYADARIDGLPAPCVSAAGAPACSSAVATGADGPRTSSAKRRKVNRPARDPDAHDQSLRDDRDDGRDDD